MIEKSRNPLALSNEAIELVDANGLARDALWRVHSHAKLESLCTFFLEIRSLERNVFLSETCESVHRGVSRVITLEFRATSCTSIEYTLLFMVG